jgi:hypothetical protein
MVLNQKSQQAGVPGSDPDGASRNGNKVHCAPGLLKNSSIFALSRGGAQRRRPASIAAAAKNRRPMLNAIRTLSRTLPELYYCAAVEADICSTRIQSVAAFVPK